MIKELNKDQLDGLAKLCFDLAKAAFILIITPFNEFTKDPLTAIIKMLISLIGGLAFTIVALVLLKVKERVKK